MQNAHPPEIPDDEISLTALWRIMVRHKWWILGVPFVAVVLAAIAVTTMKPQWEATGVIRVGAVGQVGQVGQAKQLIEPVARTVERMKLKSFADAVLASLGLKEDDPESNLYRNSLRVRALPETDLIEMKVRSYSREDQNASLFATIAQHWARHFDAAQREEAKRPVEATIAYLKKIHDELAAPSVQRLKELLAQVELQIGQTKAERDKLAKATGREDKAGFMESVVAASTLVQRDSELRALEQSKTGYEEQLGPLRTYPTAILENISVSDKPVLPKKALTIVLAALFGLLVGMLAAFFSHTRQKQKREEPPDAI